MTPHLFLLALFIINFYVICSTQSLDLSNWMKIKANALWNKSLSELTILGTHDSGSYNLTKNMMPGGEPEFLLELIKVGEALGLPVDEVITFWSKSQPSNLYDQLVHGTRYFDMRCGWNYTQNWYTYHGQIGASIQFISNDIKRFLDEHDGEIVIIEANGITGYKVNNSDVEILCQLFINIFGGYLYPRRLNVNDPFPSYGDMVTTNKRVLLSVAWNNDIIQQYDNIWYGSKSGTIQNTYANTPNISKMIDFNNRQVQLFNNHQTIQNALFKISWTLTPNGDTILDSVKINASHTLIQLADTANLVMSNWTQSNINQNLSFGNIFIFDDYLTASTQQIINALYKL